MPRKHPREIRHDEVVRECEKLPTSVMWPAPIDKRLSALVDLAIDAGEPDTLSRSELLAAVVLAAPADGETLSALLRTYRKARAGHAVVGSDARGGRSNVIKLEARRPGRR